MNRKPVSFNINVNGLFPDMEDAELIAYLNELIVSVVGFTLEVNGVDNVYVSVDKNKIWIGKSEEFSGPTQVEKLVNLLNTAIPSEEVFDQLDNVSDIDLKRTIH